MLNKEALYEQYRKFFKDKTPDEAKEKVIDLWKGYKSIIASFNNSSLDGLPVALEEAERLAIAYEALVSHYIECNRQANKIAEKLKEN